MRTISTKLSPKKSKVKMASFSNDRTEKVSSKRCKDDGTKKQNGTVIEIIINPCSSSSANSSCTDKEEESKGSIENKIISGTKQFKSSENSTIETKRIKSVVTVPPSTVQSLIPNYGFLNLCCSNPILFGNLSYPLYLQHAQFYTNDNYYRNFMYRLESTTSNIPTTVDAELDKKLLSEWRSWQRTEYGSIFAKSPEKHTASTFSIMSYNVLAEDLLTNHQYLYRHHAPQALPWDQRWKNIVAEIEYHNADILCLQEVQSTHVDTYYSQLKALGYGEIYKKRTGKRDDGCAIYYKTSKLTLINHTSVEYNQPNIFVLNRDNIAVIAKLAPKQNLENEFVVATTHLLYNRRREDVRLAQTQILLTEVDRLSYKKNSAGNSYHVPIIITGDFNFMPNTPVYQLIIKGVLRYENLESRSLLSINPNSSREEVTGKYMLPTSLGITDQCQHAALAHQRKKNYAINELEHVYLFHSERSNNTTGTKQFGDALFSSGVLSHNLSLKSAFKHRRGKEVEATTFQEKWATVDYIFYSGAKDKNGLVIEDKLNLLSRYTLPTCEQLKGINIPNMAVGSDHFSLAVKFKLNS